MIRNATTLLPYPLLAQARLAAELDGMDCAETWIEMTLRTALEKRPELADLSKRIEDAKRQAKAEWRKANAIPATPNSKAKTGDAL